MIKEFNIVVTGVGGQGVLTLSNVIAEAALKQGYDVKMSELHGLAQRGGSIPCHIRFGRRIYSPLVLQGEANLIIGLEPLEALRCCHYGSKKHSTTFLIDTHRILPISVSVLGEKYPSLRKIVSLLKQFSKKIIVLNASEIVEKETGDIIGTNIYMLGYAISRRLMPIKKSFILEALKEVIPERYVEMNERVFELGMKHK
jgi:indolepyruvate ferredoxin oxidoreductase beta subunit